MEQQAAANGSKTGWDVGVDIGGTFTDLVFYDRASGQLTVRKVPSTPDDPSRGMLAGLRDHDLGQLQRLVHATTVVLNALLQRRGADIALVTTLGFRDHIEIGDTRRYTGGLFDHRWRREKPLALPHSRRFVIAERTLSDGRIAAEPTAEQLDALAAQVEASGVDAIAVCFINAYINPANEDRVTTYLRERFPDKIVVPSSQTPEFREYPRWTTAVLNSFCAPVASRYVARLGSELQSGGYDRGVSYMGSSGGIVTGDHVVANPAMMLWGGVVGGVTASTSLGRLMGVPHMVTFDMGGTSTDVALVRHYAPSVVNERQVGAFPLAIPQVDVHSIGAGGGSIAYVEDGALKVGPRSAGAEPGPACYARGGTEFTVTDANLLLGRLRPESRLAGRLTLEVAPAREAAERLLAQTGLAGVEELAAGVVEIANTHMYGAIREVSVERGEDPAELALVAFGGAGPMHACEVAEKLGIVQVVMPREAGDFSALGLLLSDQRHDLVRGYVSPLVATDMSDVEAVFADLEATAHETLASEGFAADAVQTTRIVDMRYADQSYEEQIVVAPAPSLTVETLGDMFQTAYKRRYGYQRDVSMCEVVNLRVTATGTVAKPSLANRNGDGGDAVKDTAPVHFGGTAVEGRIIDRSLLSEGDAVEGPAVVEEYSSTGVVPPGWRGHVNEFGALVLERKE
ncbi:MAG: N-methylhydantoinase [Thermoleophilales bacterium]|jgi:N-methylhydantoinase A|nr:N-methylhydantoinase [Thermoleophilales bacterium]